MWIFFIILNKTKRKTEKRIKCKNMPYILLKTIYYYTTCTWGSASCSCFFCISIFCSSICFNTTLTCFRSRTHKVKNVFTTKIYIRTLNNEKKNVLSILTKNQYFNSKIQRFKASRSTENHVGRQDILKAFIIEPGCIKGCFFLKTYLYKDLIDFIES